MKKEFKKIISFFLSAAVMTSFGAAVYAETPYESLTDSDKAILEYNDESQEYELTDSKGNIIDTSFEEPTQSELSNDTTYTMTVNGDTFDKQDTHLSTTAPSTESSATTTTVVTVKVNRVTVTPYIAKYRHEAEGEKITTSVTQRIVTAPKTTKKTTTTKKVTTTKKKTTTTTKTRYDGIDVSRFQGNINWSKVKAAGIDFVMIRAGYGKESDQVDANFHKNIKNAQAAGIDCGVYWYSYALNTADALKEAKVCYNTIKKYKLSYPVAFDIEDPSQTGLSTATISNIIKVFGAHLENLGYYVSVYSYASFLNDKCDSSVFTYFDIWVAHTKVSKPNFSKKYGMWQYSHTGRVNGISGDVDLDYSYKNYPEIIKKNKLNGYK